MMQTRENESATATEQCPSCGCSSFLLRTATDINNRSTRQLFHYFRCPECGLVFMSDIPADMGPYYAKGYQPLPVSVEDLRRLAANERYRLDELLKLKSGGKLLEIGPWIGIFSINAKDAGFEVEVIENDKACVDFLQNTVGITAFQSNNPAVLLSEMTARYDVVVLWHSLEHLPAPWLVIENAAKALKPGGVLLVSIPNIDGYDSQVMGSKWLHLDAPRHLYFYSSDALVALCRRLGLAPAHVTTRDRLSVVLAIDAWHQYACRAIPIRYVRGLVGRTVGRIMWWIARPRQMREGLGSGLTAIFSKPADEPNSGKVHSN